MTTTNGASPPVGTLVRAPKTAELIATHLRRQIVRGELRPGATLPPERELMEQYGVSRPTLREAFRILEAETLIHVRRGARGGAQITAPDASVAARTIGLLLQLQGATIDDVYQARLVSEPACARRLATCRTQQDIDDLDAVVRQLEAEVAAQDPFVPDADRWAALTSHFHELVQQRCGNRTLAMQGAVLQDIVATHLRARIAHHSNGDEGPEQFRRLIRSFRNFIVLIRDRDADGAEDHWRSHMKAAGAYLLSDDPKQTFVVDLFK